MDIKHNQINDFDHVFNIDLNGIEIIAKFRVHWQKVFSYDIEHLEDLDFESYFTVKEMCVEVLQAMKIIL